MTVVDYGPDVAALRRRLEAAEAEVARLRAFVEAVRKLQPCGFRLPGDPHHPGLCRACDLTAALAALDAEVPRG